MDGATGMGSGVDAGVNMIGGGGLDAEVAVCEGTVIAGKGDGLKENNNGGLAVNTAVGDASTSSDVVGGVTPTGGVPIAGDRVGEVGNKVVGEVGGRVADEGVDPGDVKVVGGLIADSCCGNDP